MTYYGKLCTIFYDLDKKYAEKDEIRIYTKEIQSKDKKILEAMCGSGRVYIPLLKEGYNITGFDSSEDMLISCKKRCTDLGLKPKIFKADITKYQSNDKYDCVLIPIGSISLLIEENDLIISFKNIHGCLKKWIIHFFFFKLQW